MKILVSGSLAYDRIMDFGGRFKDHILPGMIHTLNVSFYVQKFHQSFGGTAGNIAYSVALLGEQSVILASYGSDFNEYARWCRKNRMNIQSARKITGQPTASAYIITDQDDNQIASFFAGAMLESNGQIPRRLLGPRNLAIVSPGNLTDMKRYPQVYKKTRTPYFYDPGQQIPMLSAADLIGGLKGARGLLTNDYELSLVLKKTKLSLEKLLTLTEMVVTTYGRKGSVIRQGRGKTWRIPSAKPKNTSDPTGAGDAFRAGFLAGIAKGYPVEVAGRLGAVVSVYTVEKYGTQTHSFSFASIQRRYRLNYHQHL